jgi:methyltransferase (TIGR00027 family)
VTTHQQWDIVTSVGITALGVAAARAIETHREDPLIDDPFAELFVRAANPPTPMPTTLEEVGRLSSMGEVWPAMSTYMGVRSRFFDEFFRHASAAGLTQVVILASGLDARAFRLGWPAGTAVFEIDQPKVLAFKGEVLASHGVSARCTRHAVAIDLRDDWASALVEAGFDERLPTAWLAEGLLPYLPPEAEQLLLDTIDKFSVPGSRIALETVKGMASLMDEPENRLVAKEWGLDMADVLHEDDRPAAADSLRTLGWTVTVDVSDDVAKSYGRDLGRMAAMSDFVVAERLGY